MGLGVGTVTPRPRPPKSVVAFEIARVPEVEEPPTEPPKPEQPPEPAAPRPELATKPAAARNSAPEPAEAARAEAAPVDMSGLTLTNALGAGFAMPSGNGLAREGALRVPASLGREIPAPRQVAVVEGPRLVAVKDLSSRPTPPTLDGALEQNYPTEARRRGLGGSAMVRIRIDADGMVRSVNALNESSPGFGEACRRTLRGSRWSAPRDQEGRAVATEVRYTCRFVVNP